MANKTRGSIRTYIEYYIAGSTDYSTQINALIDAAVEDISYRHNFRSLRGMATATLATNAYYVSAPTDFKEHQKLLWTLSGTGESGVINWVGENYYHNMYQYIDWASRGTGTPSVFTKIGDYLYFNTKADVDYVIRIWYQKFHQDFTTLAAGGTVDNVVHLFKPNLLAVQVITGWVLTQIKIYVPLTNEGKNMADQFEYFLERLIAADAVHQDEPIELSVWPDADRDSDFGGGGIDDYNPYEWVS